MGRRLNNRLSRRCLDRLVSRSSDAETPETKHMMPRDIETLDSIPINSNLKKDRRAIYDRCL